MRPQSCSAQPIQSSEWRIVRVCAALATWSLLAGCAGAGKDAGASSQIESATTSVYTGLRADACKEEVDTSDADETPFLRCPGVGGYSLIVRLVDAGRQSIDVVDSAQRVHPLDYQQFVTRHMSALGNRAEWRVNAPDGKQLAVALIVPVQAHEDDALPERVTRTYLAVAKLGAGQICVTDRFVESAQSETSVRQAADSANEKNCLAPLPSIVGEEERVR